MLTRRHILTAALALPFAPQRLWAATTLTMGTMQIDSLSDGNLVLPADFVLAGMPPDEMAAVIAKYNLPTDQSTPPCNLTLMRDGTNTVLFDAGAGADFQPTAGKLADAFSALGITPDDITHVIFTHGHPDHLWGVLDDFDEPVFTNATHMIGQAEFDYWTNPDTVATIDSGRTTFAVGAARRLTAMAERLEMLTDGQEVLPGVAARLTPGHTPGHMSFELRNGSSSLMVLGDAIANDYVAFGRPDWASGADQDGPMAAKTRVSFLDQIASEQMHLLGFHLPDGGIGRAERADGAYRYVAA